MNSAKLIEKYNAGEHYSESSLWTKILEFGKKIGLGLLRKVLTLFYTVRDEDTPAWAKTVIYGAIGYFIMPIDAIPDIVPLVGFSDDLGVIVTATALILTHIKKEHIINADEKVNKLFKKYI
jgi:uncharacterized membrane protein YkvA (DUF1232 family)